MAAAEVVFNIIPPLALTHPRIKPLSALQESFTGKNERLTGKWTLTQETVRHSGVRSYCLNIDWEQC